MIDLKRSINPEKILQIYKTLRNKLEQEKQRKKKKKDLQNTG